MMSQLKSDMEYLTQTYNNLCSFILKIDENSSLTGFLIRFTDYS